MNRALSSFACLALLLAGTIVPAAIPAEAAPKVVKAVGTPLSVEVGKGQLVTLDHPATTVFVADPDIADVQVKSPTLVYVFGKAGGETTLFAVGDNDQVLVNMAVHVRYDAERVQQAIHQMVPHSAVSVNSIDDALVLEGTVYSAAEGDDVRRVAERFLPDPKLLVNKMRVDAANQVNLRVRVAEVSRSVIKDLGVNWENLFTPGAFAFGLATGNPVLSGLSGVVSSGGFLTRGAAPGATSLDTVNNISAGVHTKHADVNALIDALDKHGLITVLAEPNLSAVSGEPASFLAGGEFPIPVPQGLNQVTIDWKQFGVSLNFVATIGANNRINMHVRPEVSQLSNTGAVTIDSIQVPALTVRRADTTLDVASGQSFAIAGLLQNNVNQTISKFPWLGDVPVLGQLFRSESFQRNETELVIIVTPYIVRPVATANRLQSPTDGYMPSSDSQLLLYGDEYRRQPALKQGATPATRTGAGLIGPAGFEID